MIKNLIKLFLIIQFLILLSAQKGDYFSPEKRLKFGNYLFSTKDYLRAVFEYQNYLQMVPNDTIKFKMAYAFERMNRFREAEENYKTLFFNSELENESRLYCLRLIAKQNKYDDFDSYLNNFTYTPENKTEQLNKLKSYADYFIRNQKMEAGLLRNTFTGKDTVWFNELYNLKNEDNKKSPVWASVLSAIIPGAGKLYTKNYSDGITSFLVTGLFTYLAIDNFNHNHNTRGWIFSGLAAYFYAGNVYGSYSAAQIFNARIDFDFRNKVEFHLNNNNYFIDDYEFLK